MNEDWLRTLSDTLKDHETPAPEGLWEEIDARLFPEKRRRLLPLIFRWAATVVLVGGIPLSINTFLPRVAHNVTHIQAEEIQQAEMELAGVRDRGVHGQVLAYATGLPSVDTSETEAQIPFGTPELMASLALVPVVTSYSLPHISSVESVDPVTVEGKPRVRVSLYSAQSGTDYTQNVGGFTKVSGDPLTFTALNPEMDAVIAGNREQEVRTDIHHDIPLTFGVQVAIPIRERWKLSSGLTYTRLGSSSYSGSGGYAVNTRQEVHFLGLPLQVQYQLSQGKRVGVYASTGLLFEKAVVSRVRSRYVVDYQWGNEISDRLPEHPTRWSAHLGVGVEAKVLPAVDIYVEPHFRYTFKESSGITTVHEVRPAQAGLKLGLRYNLP